MAKKNYTLEQRKKYHEKRVSNTKTSERKRSYSRSWLDGYNDKHAKTNLAAVKNEIAERKKKNVPRSSYDVMLQGYRNGLAAKVASYS